MRTNEPGENDLHRRHTGISRMIVRMKKLEKQASCSGARTNSDPCLRRHAGNVARDAQGTRVDGDAGTEKKNPCPRLPRYPITCSHGITISSSPAK
jgi:hypothetical protein